MRIRLGKNPDFTSGNRTAWYDWRAYRTMKLYWGDLHSHCAISYGHGTVAQALARARQQLDFCSITGHAFWPDMPTDRAQYAEIIDYHHEGFARLARNWQQLLTEQAAACVPREFVAFPSYEWHSLEYGDHNVYAAGPRLELLDAPGLPQLRDRIRATGAICIPHHIGYKAGYRGIDWRHFSSERSPVVEIYSLHGCAESAAAPLPYLHDMGPRDAGCTAQAGWEAGHRFGIIASTDHHGAYPGSHGAGRVAVFARELTREALWEALLARRVYAATGDKIDARLHVNGAWLGEEIESAGGRRIEVAVRGVDALETVELLKNDRRIARVAPQLSPGSESPTGCYRLRISWGWGRKDLPISWNLSISLSQGELERVETCFSGQAVVAPKQGAHAAPDSPDDQHDLPHEVLEQNSQDCRWRSITTGNLTMRHATFQSLSLEVRAPLKTRLTITANGRQFDFRLGELLGGGRTEFLRGWLSEAVQVGPATAIEACTAIQAWDDQPERDVDYYRLRVAQQNGQWAWLTPIWVRRM